MNNTVPHYSAPDCFNLEYLSRSLICNSPGNGENEDVSYEEW